MEKTYELPPLPYDYDALEPYIDEETLRYHQDMHHKAYCDKFNTALSAHPELYEWPVEKLFRDIDVVPIDIRKTVANQGGGYINHNYYFESLAPDGGGTPEGDLLEAINRDFGDFETLKQYLTEASLNQFGSGYGWLVKSGEGKLKIYSLPNQDSPFSLGDTPLLPIDVWEHAYYLKYKNQRPKYVESIWNIIDWRIIRERYLR